ncbi:MAG: hypothetical protein JRG84_10920 [Deltaproteobacteria bacterium]|nr:hypothetical protein [Deltaproteobacteria bacterium]
MTEPSAKAAAAPDGGTGGRALLGRALERICGGGQGYRFVLLRETPLDAGAIDAGDIDVLGRRSDVRSLVAHLDRLCHELGLDLGVERTGPRKTRVTLYARDSGQTVELDLWTDLWQLEAGRMALRWSDVAGLCRGDAGIVRLPPVVEAAVYLEHLHAKRKDLASFAVQSRVAHYAARLRAEGAALSDVFERLAARPPIALAREDLAAAADTLARSLGSGVRRRAPFRKIQDLAQRFESRRLQPPAHARAIAFVGPDGIGKSTLAKALAAGGEWDEHVLGKSLYRRSLVFRGLYKLNRALGAPVSQERIDEALCGLAYVVATLRLRRRLGVDSGRGLILDRYLGDFLYVGRKGDWPRFRGEWLARLCYVDVPVVHFTAPHARLAQRKQEISAPAHARFDTDMTRFYSERPRVGYLRVENGGSVEDALARLRMLLGAQGAAAHHGPAE